MNCLQQGPSQNLQIFKSFFRPQSSPDIARGLSPPPSMSRYHSGSQADLEPEPPTSVSPVLGTQGCTTTPGMVCQPCSPVLCSHHIIPETLPTFLHLNLGSRMGDFLPGQCHHDTFSHSDLGYRLRQCQMTGWTC